MEYILHRSKQKEENLQTVFAVLIELVLYFIGSRLSIDFLDWRILTIKIGGSDKFDSR